MAVGCIINLYQSYSDRGAFVQKGVIQSDEVQRDEIKVGEKLPHWPGYEKPIVIGYSHAKIELQHGGNTFVIQAGEEKEIYSSLFSQDHGVECYMIITVKME
ncbi:MAG: hypothetical protein IKT13_03875 [Paludibacteraceae bacterium]|nr:hypothetical protein [Paludibacteraceae bacterium]